MTFTAQDHTFAVCAYKENPYLKSTIESLLAQDTPSPIIISTSTPNDSIQNAADQYKIPIVINPESHGAASDWNYGYNSADTPLVTIAHQDDHYDPNFLSTVLETLNKYDETQVQFIFTDYFEIRKDEHVYKNTLLKMKRILNAPLSRRILNGSRFTKRRVLSFGNPICCPAVTLVKKNLGVSVFDETYKNSCDYKTWVDLAGQPGRFVYVPEALMGHRIYEESSTTLNLNEGIRQFEDLEILSSLWPKPLAKLIYRVYSLGEKSNDLS